jgi:hypothetical protein
MKDMVETIAASGTRAKLLKTLAVYASPDFVRKAGLEATEAQIAAYIEGAKSQRESRRRAGIKDMRAGNRA